MQPSQACFDLTKSSEGCRLTAYPDQGAFSIGYGHRGVPEGTVWTQDQADQALALDLSNAGAQVAAMVKVPLTQGQFDALCDFTFNLGSGSLAGSTLLRILNLGSYADAGEQLLRWDIAGGEVQKGLALRRQAELNLWNS